MVVPKARKLPSGSWRCQVMIDGELFSITADTEKESIAKAMEIKAELKGARKSPEKMSLECLIDGYIKSKEDVLSPSTIAGYETILRTRFQPYMKQQIYSIDWQRMVLHEKRICSAKTLKNSFALVRSALKHYGIEQPNVTLPTVKKVERSYLASDEIPVFVKAVQGTKCELVALLGLHSLRKSEILALEWNDIDLRKKTIRIHSALVKSGGGWVKKDTTKTDASTRTIPIFIPELITALSAIEDKTGPIIKGHPNSSYKQINAICAENNLPEIGIHGLRHSFCSLCYSLRIPEKVCQQLGGWANSSVMREIYTHISKRESALNVEKLSQFFEA